jgi:leucyl-tRNA synthetase
VPCRCRASSSPVVSAAPVETACPRCGGAARRETDTLDCFFDDVWCFYSCLVPIDRPDATVFPSAQVDAWMPVDRFHSGYDTLIYLHLHRFLGHVLAEAGYVRDAEPVRATSATISCWPPVAR